MLTSVDINDRDQTVEQFNGGPPPSVWDCHVDETSTLRRFDLFDHNGFGSLLQPAAHPDWPFSPNSKVNPDQQAKTPAILYADSFARGLVDWTALWAADKRALRHWQQMGCPDRPANVSLRTGEVPGARFFCCAIDGDIECPVLALKIIDLTRACFGYSPRRLRANSPRALLLYRLTPEAAALSKIRVCFVDKAGHKHAVEILLRGNQCIIDGLHKSGKPYEWPDGYPVASELPESGVTDIERFLNALRDEEGGRQ
jgi:Bifunctional DNA primase/polymerase, N-terminal